MIAVVRDLLFGRRVFGCVAAIGSKHKDEENSKDGTGQF